MAKEPKQRYVLTLKLETEKFQEDILEMRFELGRQLYNNLLGKVYNRYKEMIKTKRWRQNQKKISEIYESEKDMNKAKKICKPYFDIRSEMLREFRLNECSFHADIKFMQHQHKKNIDSQTAQKLATRVWVAIEKLLFGNGEKVHFKKYSEGLDSLEGKSNSSGIKYKENTHTLEWNKLSIKVQSKLNDYEMIALRDRICYCRIKRKFVRGRYKYSLQLILDGVPPIKVNKDTGEVKNDIGIGVVGIDIGTRTVAYVGDYSTKLYELAPRVQNIENEKRKVQRYMDRSKRVNNPDNFNENGTIKKCVKLEWNMSNRYKKAQGELKELHRKQADIRKLDHNIMTNEILANGDTILVEKMNFKGLQKRVKQTTVNEKTGRVNKKKRFGKSLANKAPSMFLTILQNKLKAKGGRYSEINTYKVKASQYSHLTEDCVKKDLSERWNEFEYRDKTIKVQRDLYSAYLIKNVGDDLETIDRELCVKDFDRFLDMHDREIERLSNLKNVSSMGI